MGVIIKNTSINPEHESVKGKTVTDLKATNIFSHLPEKEQSDAYKELFDAVNPKTEVKKTAAQPAADNNGS